MKRKIAPICLSFMVLMLCFLFPQQDTFGWGGNDHRNLTTFAYMWLATDYYENFPEGWHPSEFEIVFDPEAFYRDPFSTTMDYQAAMQNAAIEFQRTLFFVEAADQRFWKHAFRSLVGSKFPQYDPDYYNFSGIPVYSQGRYLKEEAIKAITRHTQGDRSTQDELQMDHRINISIQCLRLALELEGLEHYGRRTNDRESEYNRNNRFGWAYGDQVCHWVHFYYYGTKDNDSGKDSNGIAVKKNYRVCFSPETLLGFGLHYIQDYFAHLNARGPSFTENEESGNHGGVPLQDGKDEVDNIEWDCHSPIPEGRPPEGFPDYPYGEYAENPWGGWNQTNTGEDGWQRMSVDVYDSEHWHHNGHAPENWRYAASAELSIEYIKEYFDGRSAIVEISDPQSDYQSVRNAIENAVMSYEDILEKGFVKRRHRYETMSYSNRIDLLAGPADSQSGDNEPTPTDCGYQLITWDDQAELNSTHGTLEECNAVGNAAKTSDSVVDYYCDEEGGQFQLFLYNAELLDIFQTEEECITAGIETGENYKCDEILPDSISYKLVTTQWEDSSSHVSLDQCTAVGETAKTSASVIKYDCDEEGGIFMLRLLKEFERGDFQAKEDCEAAATALAKTLGDTGTCKEHYECPSADGP